MTEIQISNQTYRIGRLDAMSSFHVARRLVPVLSAMGVSVVRIVAEQGPDGKLTEADLLSIMEPVMGVVAKMSNEDVEFVITTSLQVIQRKQGDSWQRVMNGKSFQFQDITMPQMIQLTVAVVKENLSDFFAMLPGAQT